jgi:hypothetical protein
MHTCSCGKGYQLLRPFQEHRALCEMINLSNKNQSTDHLTDTPSLIDMWLAMKTLIRRNAVLEKEVYGLRNWANIQKKKLCVIDWLNEEPAIIDYTEWVNGIVLDKDDLEMVFEHNFIGGVFHILKRLLPIHGDISLPIKAFDQKLNTLFVCSGGSWSTIDKDDFTKLINILHHKLHKVFAVYNRDNKELIDNISNNENWYKNINKIMGGPFSYSTSVDRISSKLYNYLKFNLRALTKYEFSF